MAYPKLCSLWVVNNKSITRKVGGGILVGGQRALIPFYKLSQIEAALKAEKDGVLTIDTKVPNFLLEQIEDLEDQPENAKDLVTLTSEGDYPVDPDKKDDILTPEEMDKNREESIEEDEFDEANKDSNIPGMGDDEEDKPEWYIEPDKLKDMTKQEILDWDDKYEEVSIKRSGNAGEVKDAAYAFFKEKKFKDYSK